VGPADHVEGANKNYESEGRTFESFRARHLFKDLTASTALAGAYTALTRLGFSQAWGHRCQAMVRSTLPHRRQAPRL